MYKVNQKLKPARNVVRFRPRVCATCRHFTNDDGWGYCERPRATDSTRPAITLDVGDMLAYFTTCDMWREEHTKS